MEEFKNKYTNVELVETNDLVDIYVAINNETQEKVNLKVLKSQSHNMKYINDIYYEINELKDLRHENLIGINQISSFVENNVTYHYVETEYFANRTLWNKMVFTKFSYRQSLEIIKQVIEGLKEFNYKGLNYETLTAENIFINPKDEVKVDILSYILQKYDDSEEISQYDEFDEGRDKDLYAIGLILYQLITKDYNLKLKKLKKYVDDEEIFNIIYSLITKKLDYRYENFNEVILDINACLAYLPMDTIKDSEQIEYNEFEDDYEEYKSSQNRSKLIKRLCACAAALLIVVGGVKAIGLFNKDDNEAKAPTNIVKEEEPVEEEVAEEVAEEEPVEEETETDVADNSYVEPTNTYTYSNDYNTNANSGNNYNNNTVERPNYNNNNSNSNNNNSNSNNNSNNSNNNNSNNNTNNGNGTNNDNTNNNDNNDTTVPPSNDNESSNPGDGGVDNGDGETTTPTPTPDPTPDTGDNSGVSEENQNPQVNQEIQ